MSEDERQLRWQEYFCNLLHGKVVDSIKQLQVRPNNNKHVYPQELFTIDHTIDAIRRQQDNRATGNDCIQAELIKVAGINAASLIHDLHSQIVSTGTCPVDYKGGPIIDVYKG